MRVRIRDLQVPTSLKRKNIRRVLPTVMLVGVAMATIVALVASRYLVGGVGPMHYLDDPAVVLQGSPFAGAASVLGTMVSVAGASAAFLAASVAHRRGQSTSMLLFVGVVALVLALDDQYMIHDVVVPDLGLSELVLTGPYVLLAAVFTLRNRRALLADRDGLLFALAMVGLGVSFLVDVGQSSIAGRATVEELAKLSGVFFLTAFAVRAARRALLNPVSVPAPAGDRYARGREASARMSS